MSSPIEPPSDADLPDDLRRAMDDLWSGGPASPIEPPSETSDDWADAISYLAERVAVPTRIIQTEHRGVAITWATVDQTDNLPRYRRGRRSPPVLGWPVPPRGGIHVDDYDQLARIRTEAKRARYIRDTLPVNVVLAEAWDDA